MPSPQHEAFIQALREQPVTRQFGFVEQRAYYESMLGGVPLADDISLEPVRIAGREADLLRTSSVNVARVILHLHGGGYVIGSNRMYRDFGSRLTRASGAAVLMPDYRLAPEDPFPAALEDSIAAYRWLLERGYEAGAIAISGDSAGGGLAIATIMALRDADLPLPGAGVFISPWTDLALTGGSCAVGAVDDPIMDAQNLANMAQAYAAGELKNPLASPVYGAVSGFPPVLIFAGTRELLLDDARRLRRALIAASVDVDYVEGEALIHCWPVMVPNAPEAVECMTRIGKFLNQHCNR